MVRAILRFDTSNNDIGRLAEIHLPSLPNNLFIPAIVEAEPEEEQPTGHWSCIEDDNYVGGGYWECPSCKYRFSFWGFNLLNDMPYCPRCGGRVKTESEVEND